MTPLCRPDTPSGPGRCGKPAAWAVDHCPDWGATWDRTMTLYLCSYHAWVYAAHFSLMRCLTCGETVERGAGHHCGATVRDAVQQHAGEVRAC